MLELSDADGIGAATTAVAIVVAAALAYLNYRDNIVLLTAIFVGALGGIVHELAQSNGSFVLPHRIGNDYYLGGLFGLVAGGVAGLILAQGFASGTSVSTQLLSESFLAGLGLKGVSEAVSGARPTD